jgi:selenide,water dikinase
MHDPRILVGTETGDDAGVFALNEELALVQTLDFFSPITDDPYIFGQIAAANSLSDVYAMGGKPITALNIVCYPDSVEQSVMKEVLRGGADKCLEAGVFVLGGHTVQNEDIKFGLAVTGIIHPKEVITNKGAMPGDYLILTKPLGSGIIFAASKTNCASKEHIGFSLGLMRQLNDKSLEILKKFNVRGGTDITGFGFIGHCHKMACASGVEIEIWADKIPLMPGASEYAAKGFTTGAGERNEEHYGRYVEFANDLPKSLLDVLYDPQTSGGLLFAVPEKHVEQALIELTGASLTACCVGVCKVGIMGTVLLRGRI